jgi:hypothetical protein
VIWATNQIWIKHNQNIRWLFMRTETGVRE